jgi:hypothetical protein
MDRLALRVFEKILITLGSSPIGFLEFSIRLALSENRYGALLKRLREIVPDISNQEEAGRDAFNDYWEFKRRALQAFQCTMMLKAIENSSSDKLTIVDIGDSAGTHMLYLKELTKGKFEIDTISH